jgi:CBS domain-containing protein
MENVMQLREIMTKPVEIVMPTATVLDAAMKMRTQDVGSLPVCDDQKIVGIITDRDIAIRAVADGLDPTKTKVQEVMTSQVYACPADTDVEDACQLMEEKQVRRLVVTDKDQSPIGIVSVADIALRVQEEKAGEVVKEVCKVKQQAA